MLTKVFNIFSLLQVVVVSGWQRLVLVRHLDRCTGRMGRWSTLLCGNLENQANLTLAKRPAYICTLTKTNCTTTLPANHMIMFSFFVKYQRRSPLVSEISRTLLAKQFKNSASSTHFDGSYICFMHARRHSKFVIFSFVSINDFANSEFLE